MIQTNKSHEEGEDKPGAVLSSFTGFLAAALPWKLRNPQSASLMSEDALVLMEILKKHKLEKEITYCPGSVATRGRRNIQSVQVRCMRVLKGDM